MSFGKGHVGRDRGDDAIRSLRLGRGADNHVKSTDANILRSRSQEMNEVGIQGSW